MKKIPEILHMIWIGDNEAPDYFFDNLEKWRNLMPNWDIKVWTNSDLTEDKIESSYLALINKSNIGAQKADLLRFYVVNKFGGYYVDSDILPLRNLSELNGEDKDFIICHDLNIEWEYIINAFFAATPNNPALNLIQERMYEVDFNRKDIHLTTGPARLGEAYFRFKEELDFMVLPYWYFYRNKVGDIDLDGSCLTQDKFGAFGWHWYAATWV